MADVKCFTPELSGCAMVEVYAGGYIAYADYEALRAEMVNIERENREGWKQAAHWRSNAEQAATELEALRKRCEAVEADAARLDWLERTCVNVADEYGTGSQLYFGTYATAPLRGAIDQAIAAAQEPSHG